MYLIDSFQHHMTGFLHCVPAFINVYPIDSFQDHMTWFLHCVTKWLLSRCFNLILSMCIQLTPFKTISPDFILCIYFYQCVSNWLLSRPYDLILTPFKTIWPNFITVYQIDSFQDHLTWYLYCIPNWLLSRLF